MKKVAGKVIRIIKRPLCFGVFAASVIIFALLFVLLPVLIIPNNDIKFQISTYSIEDYLLLAILVILSAVSITVQIYKWKNPNKVCTPLLPVTYSSGTALSAIFAAIVGTATCTACIAPIVSLLGLGLSGSIFILKYKFVLSVIAILIILASIYFSLKDDHTI